LKGSNGSRVAHIPKIVGSNLATGSGIKRKRERETDKQRPIETNRARQTDRHKDRGRQTDRQTENVKNVTFSKKSRKTFL
jgi:hypothetical protein